MSGRTVRLLITGSRGFEKARLRPRWRQTVHRILDRYRDGLAPGDTLVIVQGKCPTGVDFFADEWADYHEKHPDPARAAVKNEPHPADWDAPCRPECTGPDGHGPRRKKKHGEGTYCPAAGDYRNDTMVASRPDRALIIVLDNSGGTMDCFERIMAARIPWEGHGAYTPAGAT